MRMLVKYTAYIDLDQNGAETDRSHYLSFINKEDVMEIPFASMEDLQKKAGQYTLADYIRSNEFKEEIRVYDDYKEFFEGVDTLVLYGESIAADFSNLLER